MRNVNLEANNLRSTGGNWYKYFYDDIYGWSWSMAYIKDSKEETSGKRFRVRINHRNFWDKWQGWEYKGEMGRDFGDKVTYGIEIYTPTGTKIKTYDTVKIDKSGNIIIGGDTVFNIIGELIQAGNAEYMIGKSDGIVKDSKGNIVSDEVISAEIEKYGNVDYIGVNIPWDEGTEHYKRWVIRQKWPWVCYDDESIEGVDVTLHIKDGTKIISLCGTRTHFSNTERLLNGETTTAGTIRLDDVGKIVLSNGVIINAPKNTTVSVEYEDGESTITIGDDNATITQANGTEITVPQGTVIDNKGNVIK
jgi:hypothetical protein